MKLKMPISVLDIAELIGAKIIGDSNIKVTYLSESGDGHFAKKLKNAKINRGQTLYDIMIDVGKVLTGGVGHAFGNFNRIDRHTMLGHRV